VTTKRRNRGISTEGGRGQQQLPLNTNSTDEAFRSMTKPTMSAYAKAGINPSVTNLTLYTSMSVRGHLHHLLGGEGGLGNVATMFSHLCIPQHWSAYLPIDWTEDTITTQRRTESSSFQLWHTRARGSTKTRNVGQHARKAILGVHSVATYANAEQAPIKSSPPHSPNGADVPRRVSSPSPPCTPCRPHPCPSVT
jgi:hypothetical protein